MFTFLPNPYKSEVAREYRKRVFTVAFALLALLAFSAAVLSAPSYIILSVKRSAASLSSEKSVAQDAASNAGLETKIKDIKAKIALLKGISGAKPLVSVLAKTNARLTSGISITGMTFKRDTDPGSIVLSGSAATRDDLVAFSKSLQGEPSFKNVSLPVSALAKSKNIGFTITIDSAF
ncbi:MAG TPA: PilN domain-containing protein [Candidatus Paceibacterota bacterium]|nr:PilN domain-containing protein [Candidatus Paceibacterota bacterium]